MVMSHISSHLTCTFRIKCLLEVRGPLVDLGVSEYGILSAIATLSDTQHHLGLNQGQTSSSSELRYSADDITLFRQIALDLQRSFPTHRSLMGDSPEAIEGQAKLFRVLIAYGKYSPQVGYSQGLSAVFRTALTIVELLEPRLMELSDEGALLSLLLRVPVDVERHKLVTTVTDALCARPFLCLCVCTKGAADSPFLFWRSVGSLPPRRSEESFLPAWPPYGSIDTKAQYAVLIPALWNTEVQDWELKCMNSLVLDESHHGPEPKLTFK
ncbi:hypothetical protein EYF80_015803 [Liparis tanakae]|uniref:Rab-GAP TBC domain-containing protein n=1 Tax=Liparis tanakae TaxID=230148 RepID=A0A4Z2I9A6_9TELE|nr:hypothetical protein EYF80_015803 [Liparis tanakae]